MRKTRWSIAQLERAVRSSFSIRETIKTLGLVPVGGNYQHIQRIIEEHKIDISHFTGKGWRKDRKFAFAPRQDLADILVENSNFQTYKLKRRLFRAGLKQEACELCGWAKKAAGGRIPVELDHINGNRYDNRIENLRILCPNCHSLQSTHRGMNQQTCRGGGVGRHATLKMS